MKMVDVSVVMSVFREPSEWVEQAICSILEQSYQNFEFIIIIDDPENSALITLVSRIENQDERVKIIINERNLGLTKSLNIGLSLAKGKYIARMDADDISLPHRFQKQIDLMEDSPDIVACGTAIEKFGKTNQIVFLESDPDQIMRRFTRPSPYLSPIAHPTAFIRADVLRRYGIKYNERFKTGQDYALWSELLFRGKLTNLNEVLLRYRTSELQITSRRRSDQLSVVNQVIESHIKMWLRSIGSDVQVTPDCLRKLRRTKKVIIQQEMLDSFIYGLLLNSKYRWHATLKYLLRDTGFKVSFRSKLRLLARKMRS